MTQVACSMRKPNVRNELARVDVVYEGRSRAGRLADPRGAISVAHGKASHRAMDVRVSRARIHDGTICPAQ